MFDISYGEACRFFKVLNRFPNLLEALFANNFINNFCLKTLKFVLGKHVMYLLFYTFQKYIHTIHYLQGCQVPEPLVLLTLFCGGCGYIVLNGRTVHCSSIVVIKIIIINIISISFMRMPK